MAFRLSKVVPLLVLAVLFGSLTAERGPGLAGRAWAQESDRGRTEGESREDRRSRWRRFGSGERGRGSRGDSRGDSGDSRRDERRDGAGSTSGDSSPASTTTPSPSAPSTASTSSTASKPAASSTAGSMAMTDYAKSLVKQYDKNGDMMLQPEERKELRGRAAESDLNKDGVITIDELVAHLSTNSSASKQAAATSSPSSSTNSSTSSSSTTSGSSSSASRGSGDSSKVTGEMSKRVLVGSAGGLASNAKEGDKRRSYRFTPATERLPSGLPSWFTSKDKNHDGQVQMSEYSSYWSNSVVAEFGRYDLNGDGMITPKEVLKKR